MTALKKFPVSNEWTSEQRELAAAIVNKHYQELLGRAIGLVRDRDVAQEIAADSVVRFAETYATRFCERDVHEGNHECAKLLFVILRNAAIDKLRKQKKLNEFFEGGFDDGSTSVDCASFDSPFDSLSRKERWALFERALSQIEFIYRDIIVAIEIGGDSYEEFARQQNIPIGTVKGRLNRARFHITNILNELQKEGSFK